MEHLGLCTCSLLSRYVSMSADCALFGTTLLDMTRRMDSQVVPNNAMSIQQLVNSKQMVMKKIKGKSDSSKALIALLLANEVLGVNGQFQGQDMLMSHYLATMLLTFFVIMVTLGIGYLLGGGFPRSDNAVSVKSCSSSSGSCSVESNEPKRKSVTGHEDRAPIDTCSSASERWEMISSPGPTPTIEEEIPESEAASSAGDNQGDIPVAPVPVVPQAEVPQGVAPRASCVNPHQAFYDYVANHHDPQHLVWVTCSGSRYHAYENCGALTDTRRRTQGRGISSIPLQTALRQKKVACLLCWAEHQGNVA
jgi:hypothetical protein